MPITGGAVFGKLGFKVEVDDSAFQKMAKAGAGSFNRLTQASADSNKKIQQHFKETFGQKLLGLIGGLARKLPTLLLGTLGAISKIVTTVALGPLGLFFRNLPLMIREGADLARMRLAPALALSTRRGVSLSRAIELTHTQLSAAAMTSLVLPKETAKLAFWYNRLAGTSAGFVRNLESISRLSFVTGEQTSQLMEMSMEWAKAFQIDIPTGLHKIANSFGYILQSTGATLSDIKMIGTWLLPLWSTQFGASIESLQSMLAIVAKIAEKGTGMPIQTRAFENTIRSLIKPSDKLLSILAGYNVELFKSGRSASLFRNKIQRTGKSMLKLYEQQDKLVKQLAAGRITQEEYRELMDEITQKIKDQELIVRETQDVWGRMGAVLRDPMDILEDLYVLQKKLGADSAEWGRVIGEIAQGSGAALVNMVIAMAPELKKTRDKIKALSEEMETRLTTAAKTTSDYWRTHFLVALEFLRRKVGLVLGEPARVGIFKGLFEAIKDLNQEIEHGALGRRLEKIGQNFKKMAETYIVPTITDIAEYLSIALIPKAERTTKEEQALAAVQDRLTENIKGLISGLKGVIAEPLSMIWSYIQDTCVTQWEILKEALLPKIKGAIDEVYGHIKGKLDAIQGHPLLKFFQDLATRTAKVGALLPPLTMPLAPLLEKDIERAKKGGPGVAIGLGATLPIRSLIRYFEHWGERIGAAWGQTRDLMETQEKVTEEVSSSTEKASQETVAFAKRTLETMKTFANKQEKLSVEIGLLRRQIRGLQGAR